MINRKIKNYTIITIFSFLLILQMGLTIAYEIQLTQLTDFSNGAYATYDPAYKGHMLYQEPRWKYTFTQADCPAGTDLVTAEVIDARVDYFNLHFEPQIAATDVTITQKLRLDYIGQARWTDVVETGIWDIELRAKVYETPTYIKSTNEIAGISLYDYMPPQAFIAADGGTASMWKDVQSRVIAEDIIICD